MTFEIRKAQRQGARLLIQLSGVSGSGKTYTALQLAYGLAGNDADKVVMIDTENRRGSLYADSLRQPFNIIDFYAPFSPARYIQAIEAACAAGAEVIVIDSTSHEWESEGGCEWIANQTRFPDWKRAKAEHKRFMTYMLQCPAHVIACTRAREKVDFSDPKNPIKLGIQPIQEKNFLYEATVSLMMHDQGLRQDVLKCPAELQAVLGRGQGYVGAADGQALRQWVDGGAKVNPAIEHHRGILLNTTEQGLQALQAAWLATPANVRKSLGDKFKDQLKAAASEYDAQRQAVQPAAPASVQALNSQIVNAPESASAFDQPVESEQNQNSTNNNSGVF